MGTLFPALDLLIIVPTYPL